MQDWEYTIREATLSQWVGMGKAQRSTVDGNRGELHLARKTF